MSRADRVDTAIVEINMAPDWRGIRFPNDGGETKKLIDALMKHAKATPNEARELVMKLVASGETDHDLEIAGKIYIFNRLYCNVPRHSKRNDWKVFGGWGGIVVDENTINSLYPLVLNKGEFKLEQFSGYNGPPFQALDEFDWLFKRFGQRFEVGKPASK